MKTLRRRGGFTLLELLVVIALMGLVSTLGTKLFFTMTDAWNSSKQRTDLDKQADDVFKSMRQDFEQMVSPRLTGVSVKGVERVTQDARFWNQPLGDDEITFALLAPAGNTDWLRCMQGRYYIAREDGAAALVREVKDFNMPAVRKVTVGQDVLSMYVEYLADNGAWEKAWDRPELPEALRVSLTLVNPNSLEQVTRKAVFPVRVK